MRTRRKYKYKKLTVTFDLEYSPEKEMIEWLEKHKGPKNNLSVMMKNALKLLIEATRKEKE